MKNGLPLIDTKEYKIMELENDNKYLEERRRHIDINISELFDKLDYIEDYISNNEEKKNIAANCKRIYRETFLNVGPKVFFGITLVIAATSVLINWSNSTIIGTLLIPSILGGVGALATCHIINSETREITKAVKRGENKIEYDAYNARRITLKERINEHKVLREEISTKISKNNIAINKTKKFIERRKLDSDVTYEKPYMLRLVK